jgi:hypothetical protein
LRNQFFISHLFFSPFFFGFGTCPGRVAVLWELSKKYFFCLCLMEGTDDLKGYELMGLEVETIILTVAEKPRVGRIHWRKSSALVTSCIPPGFFVVCKGGR